MRPLLTALLVLTACKVAGDGPLPVYDPEGGFFDTPWPSDDRVSELLIPDVEQFPNPEEIPLLQTYIDLAAEQRGWGNNGPVLMRFQAALDLEALPDPEASVQLGSPLLLLDVDPTSPWFGEAHPVWWRWYQDEGAYVPARTLSVAPLPGFPLRPATTYALVVTTDLARVHPDLDLSTQDGLRDALFLQQRRMDEVAMATVFTTQDPLDELDRMASFIEDHIRPEPLDQRVSLVDETLFFKVWAGKYQGPLFQHGQRPYATEGGGFRFGTRGMPDLYDWDDIRIAISTPPELDAQPATGWPVVIYAHGTGGDYRSHTQDNSGIGTASQLARAGMVGIGFDQPLHGIRDTADTDPSTHSFNYLNPEASRANFRQGAVDILYLAKALSQEQVVFESEDGDIVLDPDRIYFMGHSHGGLTGALALPWLGNHADAAMLSAAGGVLSITVVERQDPMDIASMFEDLLRFDEGEEVSEHHPVMALIQWLTDVTDPVNYAPYWYAEDGGLHGAQPTPVLLTNGTEDSMTPWRSAEALAASARLPILEPHATWPVSWDIRGLEASDGPLSGNAVDWNGQPITGGFSQWEGGSHWVVFEEKDASNMVRHFFETASRDEAEIDL